ncbi:MAG: hypothetical protein WC438_02255 [Candidatus Pacearchaeota archaeon]
MYNLKEGKGTYKGIIGECLFKLTRRYLILTKFFNRVKYLEIFSWFFDEPKITFLKENWYSIDAIELDYKNKKPILFEIKTLNDFYYAKLNGINRIPLFSQSTIDIYKKALDLGFEIKIAKIWLKKDWNYNVEITDFEDTNYIVSKPRRYDKK